MLRSQQTGSADPVIERLINDMIRDDTKFVKSEMRTVHRETLVVPVTLHFKDGTVQHTFSRNISPMGVCLIGKEQIQVNQVVDLEVYRISGESTRIVADARWCKPFGKEYFASGWKFLQLRRV